MENLILSSASMILLMITLEFRMILQKFEVELLVMFLLIFLLQILLSGSIILLTINLEMRMILQNI